MRKKIYRTSCVITGVAALFVGLAGTVQAIPITLRDHNAQQALHSLGQNSHNQSRVSAAGSLLSGSVRSLNTGGQRSAGLGNLHRRGHGVPVTDQGAYPISVLRAPITPVSPVRLPQAPIRVLGGGTASETPSAAPDGGTTAVMMAGSLCGLALLRKKLKA